MLKNFKLMHTLARWSLFVIIILGLILVPFALFEGSVNGFFAGLRGGADERPWLFGLWVAALMAGDVFLPVPSSIANAAVGSVCGWWMGGVYAFLGLTAGCYLGYALGSFAGPTILGKLLGEKQEAHLRALQSKIGFWAWVVCRPIPVLAEASVLVAGLGRASIKRFSLAILPSNAAIAFGYAYAGSKAIDSHSFLWIFLLVMLFSGFLFGIAKKWG